MIQDDLLANKEQLRDYLAHNICDPRAAQELQAYLDHNFERFIITFEFLPQTAGHVLELGATPYFLTSMIQRFRPDYRLELANFFGEDVADPDVIHECRWENAKYGEQHALHFRQFNVERQPFPYLDEQLDGVLFCEILEHLTRDPVAALLECHRILKPGGWLLLTTPNFVRCENIDRLWTGRNPCDQYSGYGPYGRHNREYTLSELEQLLAGIGFQIQRLEARSIHLSIRRSWIYFVVRLLRSAHLNEEHLFCLAYRGDTANHERPAWLYRSLPAESTDLSSQDSEGYGKGWKENEN